MQERSNIVNSTTQITEGISAGMGIDLKSQLMGVLGGKLAADNQPPAVVVPQVSSAAETPVIQDDDTETE